jgi:drug/metabolite transporter (DMT)-like permease
MWGLASALFFAVYSLMGSVAVGRFSPYTTLLYGLGFAAAFWLIWLGPRSVLSAFSDIDSAAAVLFVAVVGTVIPFSAFLSALHYIPPTNATVTSTIEPVLAGLGAYVLFGEALSPGQLVGGILVLAAIAVVQWPEKEPIAVLPPPD